jgi:hypothetical protein
MDQTSDSSHNSAHLNVYLQIPGKGKGKVHPITGHKGARWGWVVNATPRPLYPRERPGTHCTGGWVRPRAGLAGCGISRSTTGIRSPDRPARSK